LTCLCLLLSHASEILTAAVSSTLPAVCSASAALFILHVHIKLEDVIPGLSVIDLSMSPLLSHAIVLLTSVTPEELPAAYFA